MTVPIGGELDLNVVAIGPLPLTYQWMRDITSIDGATNSTFRINPFGTGDEGIYSVTVNNGYGATTSTPIQARYLPAPQIVQALTNYTAAEGETVRLEIVVSGEQPFRYTWFDRTGPIAGETNAYLVLTNVGLAQAGTYRVRVENALGASESSAELSFWPVLQVTSLEDQGPGTLRDAIGLAATTPQASRRDIVLPANAVIRLNSQIGPIQSSMRIVGVSPTESVIDGGGSNSVFYVDSTGRLSLEMVTVQNGLARVDQSGGAIRSKGAVEVKNCMFVSNKTQGGFGGAIANLGTLVVNSSTFVRNVAQGESSYLGGAGAGFGGAIYSEGGLFITNATFSANQANGGSAGKAYTSRGPAPVTGGGGPEGGAPGSPGFIGEVNVPSVKPGAGGFGSGGGQGSGVSYPAMNSFSPDQGGAGGFGGGGGAPSGPGGFGGGNGNSCLATNLGSIPALFVDGSAGGGGGMGGALFVRTGSVVIVNCTIADNSVSGGHGSASSSRMCDGGAGSAFGGGIYNYKGTIALKNSIVARNSTASTSGDIGGNVQSNGHNLIANLAPDTGIPTSDLLKPGQDVGLGKLADNGGPTLTYALALNSIALGRGTAEVTIDQRGVKRGDAIDLGAFQGAKFSIAGVSVEGNELALYLEIPNFGRVRIDVADRVSGPWVEIGRQDWADKPVRIAFAASGSAKFVRVIGQ